MKGIFPLNKFRELETPFYYYDANLLRQTLQTIKEESGKYNKFCVHYAVKANANHKNGVLLRGDIKTVGNASKGYTQGIMAGYYMNVYNHGGVTEFRIYKSTESTSLNMFNSATVNLSVGTNQSVWYRASVSGTARVELKLEYSTDGGKTWNLGTSTTDEGGDFVQGATQYVWGLAAEQGNFLIDDITFEGITYEGVETGIYSVEDGVGGEVVREEYFDLSGRRIVPGSGTKGVVIRRSYLSDGTVKVDKLMKE